MASTNDEVVGPAAGFRVAGNFLRELPADLVVASYQRHQWWVKDKSFTSYEVRDPAHVYFQDAERTRTQTFGPFARLIVAGGTMYADGELFAKFVDENVLWHAYPLEPYWPSLVIAEPASARVRAPG